MPMLVLAMRVESELIFRTNYRHLLGKKGLENPSEGAMREIDENQSRVLRLINGIISATFDQNLFYSRLSFLESGKDGLDIKSALARGKMVKGFKLPALKQTFNTRSALVKNLIPQPSEGRVRAIFG